jgi:uncharacterized membrane protein
MNRIPFILSTIAMAVVAGCATESGITSAPAPVVLAPAPSYVLAPSGQVVVPQATGAPGTIVLAAPAAALRAGYGRIESILALPAAAGGTAPNPSKRIVMRMDDTTVQYFDTQAAGLAVGDRIEITKNGTMRHPA